MLPVVAVSLLVLATLTALVQTSERVRHWDATIARWAADDMPAWLGGAAEVLTHAADTNVYTAASLIVTGLLLVIRRFRLAAFIVTVTVGQWLLSNLLKNLVGRERPDLHRLVDAAGYSFPSGHATAAAALYLALALIVITLKPTWHRTVVLVVSLTMGVAVAATRVFVGVHWTTDVIGGLALGWSWCLICAMTFRVVPRPRLRRAPLAAA